MKLLALDTSTETLSIAVQDGDKLWEHTSAGGAQASSTLIPAIYALLAQAGLKLAELDAIVFGRGPGSFTGLRTACSVVQGLALGAGLKVLPVDTLMAVAQEARLQLGQASQHTHILAALDARMGEVYADSYVFNSNPRSFYKGNLLKSPEKLLDHLAEQDGSPTLLAGNLRPALDAQLPPQLRHLPHVNCLPTGRALLHLSAQLMATGGLVDAQEALPLYIRDKVALTTAEREAHNPS
jgi:tRNA threonylcarbamoyladenosine biosynthesis protein TsaB